MWTTFRALLSLRSTTLTNLFIYYIKMLPFIGYRIPSSLYANLGLKQGIAVVTFLISTLLGFALRFAYVGLLLYFPVVALGDKLSAEEQLSMFVHIFVVISFILAAISSATILEPKREKYVAVKLMRMSPDRYMRAVLAYRYLTFLIYLVPAMLVFVQLLGGSGAEALMLSLALTIWRMGAEFLHAKLFDKTGIILIKQTVLVWIVIFAGYIAAYAPLFLDVVPPIGEHMRSGAALSIVSFIGLLLSFALYRYRGYRSAVDAATKRDDPLLDLGRMVTEAQKTSVQSKDSDYAVIEQPKLEGKEGYAYLNAIFFSRHASLIREPLRKRLIIVLAGGASIAAAAYLMPDFLERLPLGVGFLPAFLILSMLFLSIGEKLCKAMFYNCDMSLARYGFYRADAYKHFKLRLRRIFSMNLLLAGAFGLAVTSIALAAGLPFGWDMMLVWIGIASLSVFFSVHHLFMYYIFQPYSTEMNVKSPFYFVINTLVSALYSFTIIFRVSMESFAVLWGALALVYTIGALLAVRKYGARTFRVK